MAQYLSSLCLFCIFCANNVRALQIDLLNLSIDEIHHQIRLNNVTCVDITNFFLNRIDQYNPTLNALVTVANKSEALAESRKLDELYAKENGAFVGSLHCVPTVVKDNIWVKGYPMTLGIKFFGNAISGQDAPVVQNLRRAGAIILGTANLQPFAMGSIYFFANHSHSGGVARNPYAMTNLISGSSTGTAVAVAARLAVLGLGTDSSGSVTAPASQMHLFGMRPPIGQVDIEGVFPLFGKEFDTVGPVALNAKDLTILYHAIQKNKSDTEPAIRNTKGIRIGLLYNFTYGSFNIFPLIAFNRTYSVNEEIQGLARRFESRMDLLNNRYNISIVRIYPDLTSYYQTLWARNDSKYVCIVDNVNEFLRKYPMKAPNGTHVTDVSQILDEVSNRINWYAYKLKQYLWWSDYNCTSIKDLHMQLVAEAQRLAKEEIYKDVDIIAKPVLHFVSSPSNEMLDLYGNFNLENELANETTVAELEREKGMLPFFSSLFGYPALSIPLGFTRKRRGAPLGFPAGLMLETIPENVDLMLEFARIYDQQFVQPKIPKYFT